MISDALSEFVHCIDDYLNDPDFDRIYEGEPRDRIIRLRNEAEYIRLLLDAPPRCPLPPEAVLSERIEAQRTRNVEDRCYVLASEAEALAVEDATGCSLMLRRRSFDLDGEFEKAMEQRSLPI